MKRWDAVGSWISTVFPQLTTGELHFEVTGLQILEYTVWYGRGKNEQYPVNESFIGSSGNRFWLYVLWIIQLANGAIILAGLIQISAGKNPIRIVLNHYKIWFGYSIVQRIQSVWKESFGWMYDSFISFWQEIERLLTSECVIKASITDRYLYTS